MKTHTHLIHRISSSQRNPTTDISNQPKKYVTSEESPVVLAIKEIFAQDTTPTIPKSRKVTIMRLLTASECLAEMKDKEAVKKRLLKEKEEAKKRKLIEKERKKKEQEAAKNKKNEKKSVKKKSVRKQTVKKSAKKKRKVEVEVENDCADDPPAASDSEIEELCGICNKSFQKDFNGERWIKCINCGQWFHFDCVDNADNVSDFYCSQCFEQ